MSERTPIPKTLSARGLALAAMRAYVKERFGETGWNRLLVDLPPWDREQVWDKLILPTAWYPVQVFDGFLDALDAQQRAHAPQLGVEIGERIAQSAVKIYHALVMPFVSPETVLSRVSSLWPEYLNAGAMSVIERSEKRVRIRLDNPGVHRILCSEIAPGWGARAIKMTGATPTRTEHVQCVRDGADACEYEVGWK